MKALKIILGVLVALAAIYFTLAFVGPAHIHVEREALIEAPVDVVFPEVNSLKKWPAWDPWQAMDTNMVNTYSGPETGVGNKNTWTSEVMGNGSQELTESIENSRIASHLSMEWMGESDASFTFTPEGKTTRVKWVMDKDITFFGRPFMVFMDMDEMLGKDFEKGLANLNAHCKALLAANPPIEATVLELVPFSVLGIADTTTADAWEADFNAVIGALSDVVAANKLTIEQNMIAFWPKWGDTVIFEVAFPVANNLKLKKPGRATVRTVDVAKVVKTTHRGGTETSEQTHLALEKWIQNNGLTESGVRWEEYETLADSSEVVHIFVPVK